ncbi:MAG: hypothetical protein GX610_15795 [Rhodococcus sp.]|nr:hypothetical protein [Rhodococcus sp. (in: high G+C Gram-positive bacteria)]
MTLPIHYIANGIPLPSAAYPNIGFDPAPGNANTVGLLATELRDVANKVREAHDSLVRVGHSDGIWQGEAANAFRNEVGELPKCLDDAGTGLQDASVALRDWGMDLESMQKTAQRLEDEARAAKKQLERAEADPGLDEAGRTYTDDAQLAAAQARLDAATDALKRARQELQDIIDRAERLLRQHSELAGLTAQALDKACSDAPEEGFFEGLANLLEDIGEGIADLAADIWQFIKDNADLINEISNVLSTCSSVLGVAAMLTWWCPPLSGALGTVSLGLGAAALAGHALAMAAGADVTLTTIGMDTLGVVGGGGAMLMKGFANSAEASAKASTLLGQFDDAAASMTKSANWTQANIGLGNTSTIAGVAAPYGIQNLNIEGGVTTLHEDIGTYLVPDNVNEAITAVLTGPIGGPIVNVVNEYR